MAATTKSLTPEAQTALVAESLSTIRQQTAQMKKCLETRGKFMDALKHASTFLSELRTSSLTPKNYYELYIGVFDSLEYLANYLSESHPTNHLSNLYELVQYAGNIVPRLYLMITVGTVYMGVKDAPVKEIMKDLIEMCRGVQHPIRGLFLRYYLSQRTKNLLPEDPNGKNGGLKDSVQFIITNFVEMNKLWVRLQHQGHSRERLKRLQERQELQILVGSNLVRLSQLEGIDKKYYKENILPAILEQIIQCRDLLAQEYLLDVIIQVFPDEFHLYTLQEFLDATVNLIPEVSLTKILGTLMNRLTTYIDRESLDSLKKLSLKEIEAKVQKEDLHEEDEIKEDDQQEEQQADVEIEKTETKESDEGKKLEVLEEQHVVEAQKVENEKEESSVQEQAEQANEDDEINFNELFNCFYYHFLNLNKVRPDLTIYDLTALYFSLMKLSLSYYPDNFENIDLIFQETLNKFNELKDTVESSEDLTEENLRNILLLPLNFSVTKELNLKLLLSLKNYEALLSAQSLKIQLSISNEILNKILTERFKLETEEEIFKVFSVLESIIFGKENVTTAQDLNIDQQDHNRPQNLAKLFHLIYNKDPLINRKLLGDAHSRLNHDENLIKIVYPSLVFNYLKIVMRLNYGKKKSRSEELNKTYKTEILTTFLKISKLTDRLYENGDMELALKLLVSVSEVSNQVAMNEVTNEFFIKIFAIYEELMNSKQQYGVIIQLISTLIGFYKSFNRGSETDRENYNSLITKTVLYSAKLLKKPDQCRAVSGASHLWFQSNVLRVTESSLEQSDSSEDNKRVLECLQKALRISDSCVENSVSVELFVEILNQCIYYYIHGNLISASYISNLIELIKNNLNDVDQGPINHFERTLAYITTQKQIDSRFELIRY